MSKFVPNAIVRLVFGLGNYNIGKSGELVEERDDICVVDFDGKHVEVPTNILEANDADDQYDENDPDVLLNKLLSLVKRFDYQNNDFTTMDDDPLAACEQILSETEHYKDQMTPQERKEWSRISAEVADQREMDDDDLGGQVMDDDRDGLVVY